MRAGGDRSEKNSTEKEATNEKMMKITKIQIE